MIVYTGGTIGSVHKDKNDQLSPLVPGSLIELMAYLPGINEDVSEIIIDNKKVGIGLLSFTNPIDSSNISPKDWVSICNAISDGYSHYSGFVIIHGTDTMAYTASALTFLIGNLTKPIIITGSMRPVGESRTDGIQNLVTSIQIASPRTFKLPIVQEVCIFFRNKLLRGCRTTKISSSKYDGFDSPNFPHLGYANEHIKLNREYLRRIREQDNIQLGNWNFSKLIVSITIFPGIGMEIFEGIIKSKKIKAVILRTYGNGNAPSDVTFLEIIRKLANSGKVVVNVCQTLDGEVEQGLYDVSSGLISAGVISGSDLTDEAAYAKLGFLLARYDNLDMVKELFLRDLHGEQSRSVYNYYFGPLVKPRQGMSGSLESKIGVQRWHNVFKNKTDFRNVDKVYLNIINVTCTGKKEIYFEGSILFNGKYLYQRKGKIKKAEGVIAIVKGMISSKPRNFLLEIPKSALSRIEPLNYIWVVSSKIKKVKWEKLTLSIHM